MVPEARHAPQGHAGHAGLSGGLDFMVQAGDPGGFPGQQRIGRHVPDQPVEGVPEGPGECRRLVLARVSEAAHQGEMARIAVRGRLIGFQVPDQHPLQDAGGVEGHGAGHAHGQDGPGQQAQDLPGIASHLAEYQAEHGRLLSPG